MGLQNPKEESKFSTYAFITLPIPSILTAQAHGDVKVTEILLLFLKLGIWAFMNHWRVFGFFSFLSFFSRMNMSPPEIYWQQKVFSTCAKAFLKVLYKVRLLDWKIHLTQYVAIKSLNITNKKTTHLLNIFINLINLSYGS